VLVDSEHDGIKLHGALVDRELHIQVVEARVPRRMMRRRQRRVVGCRDIADAERSLETLELSRPVR